MRDLEKHVDEFIRLLRCVEATGPKGVRLAFSGGVAGTMEMIEACKGRRGKVMFIGNGGSAAVAGHMALDFWHALGVRSQTFLDGPLLTCLANDHGYEAAYALAVERFADPGDLLAAISSSGRSKNILNAVAVAREKGCGVITLSGFSRDNPLRSRGDFNFYVPSMRYGHVESLHGYILHALLDVMAQRPDGKERDDSTLRTPAKARFIATQ